MKKAILFSVVLFAAFGLSGCSYNDLNAKQQNVKSKWSNVESSLQRRADLIPNLVETVKGYAKHEKEVFENVTKARTAMMSAGSMQEKAAANDMLSGALKSLFAVAEAYPELKANTNFQDLQRQLEDTEDKVATSILLGRYTYSPSRPTHSLSSASSALRFTS